MDRPRARWSPLDRSRRPSPAAPPHPGRCDRPARRGHPMTTSTRTGRSLVLTLVAALAAGLGSAGIAVAHGPDPFLSGGRVRSGPGTPLPLAIRRGTDRDDQDRDQGGRVGRQRHPGVARGDVRLRRIGRQPDRLRRGRDPAASTASPASPGMPRTGSRCGCASRVTSSTGARSSGARPTRRSRTGATTPRRSRSTNSGTSKGSGTTSTRTTTPTTSTPSSRPTRGRDRTPAGTSTPSVAATRRRSSSSTT